MYYKSVIVLTEEIKGIKKQLKITTEFIYNEKTNKVTGKIYSNNPLKNTKHVMIGFNACIYKMPIKPEPVAVPESEGDFDDNY